MKTTINAESSQISPAFGCVKEYSYQKSLYASMFIDDFCSSFSCSFSGINKSREFFKIEPSNSYLEKILTNKRYSFLEYDFDQLLQQNMYSLILSGQSYVEIVLAKDENGELQEIAFEPLVIETAWRKKGTTIFRACGYDKKVVKYEIPNERLIKFSLKDLGFTPHYFIKLINRMKSLDLPNPSLVTVGKMGFNITDFKQMSERKLLKLNDKTYWLGRNYNNEFLSECYLLFRVANYKMLRFRFLDYFLKEYNQSLKRLGDNYGFSGRIITSTKINYNDCLEKLAKGDFNTSQASNFINSNH